MLTVFGPSVLLGHMNASPFVGKLETWLRLAGIPYVFQAGNPLKAPKGKMPFVEDDGVVMGDSQLIIERLTEKYKVTLDDHLSDTARAEGHLARRALEEGAYFGLAYTRWVWPPGWTAYQPIMRAAVPGPVLWWVRRSTQKSLYTQGPGRHSHEEVLAMNAADFVALAGVLGERPYLLGDRPSSVDATAYAFTHGILAFPVETPASEVIRARPNLMAYVERVGALAWPPVALAKR